MKKYLNNWTCRLSVTMLGLAGCASDADVHVDEVETSGTVTSAQAIRRSAPDVGVVGKMIATRGEDSELRHEPLEVAYAAMVEAVTTRMELASPLHVYELSTTEEVDSGKRALELGMGAFRSVETKGDRAKVLRSSDDSNLLLRVSSDTGAELFLHQDRFQRDHGNRKDRGNGFYLASAQKYIKSALHLKGQGQYLYRVIRTMNQVDGPNVAPVVTVGHVKVVFNDSVDGVPIVGPGSKISVFMNPDGVVSGHHDTTRAWKSQVVATLGAGDLVEPDYARREVEDRLSSEGQSVDHYNIARREFGYYRSTGDQQQNLLAPYYCFDFEPKPDVVAMKRWECTIAIRDERLRARVEADNLDFASPAGTVSLDAVE